MIKRVFDFFFSAFGLIFLSPVFLLVAILVWLQDFGSPFFVQERIGRGGKPFSMLKFRSMRRNNAGKALTVGDDPRITPIGKILRKSKLDELPQLWNVLVGDMSLVGPRPEVKKFVDLYSDAQRKVLLVRPGITDPASVAYINEQEVLAKVPDPEKYYIEKLMADKININLAYQRRANLVSDLKLILVTVQRIFS